MKVKFTYFKESGKFYATGEADYPDMGFWDFVSMLRGAIQSHGQGDKLPGLSGMWSQPILVQIEGDHPPQLINVGRTIPAV